MTKIINFMEKYKLYIAVSIVGYLILRFIATGERSYDAIGGEIWVFAIPFIIYAIRQNIKDTKEALEKE